MSARVSFTESVTLNALECAVCGVFFAITDRFEHSRRKTGDDFYCPNGHTNVYRDSLTEKLKKAQAELDQKTRELTEAKCQTLRERTAREEKERELKRQTRRVSNGVCPCCNRSFTNLRRHMATKHPETAEQISTRPKGHK